MSTKLRAKDLHWGEAPLLHGTSTNPRSFQVSNDIIDFIDQFIDRHSTTLETGAGVSTILFALKGASHTCIVPSLEEIQRIQDFCRASGISHRKVTFIADRSEFALARLPRGILDLVLIDGSHGFASPMIDCYLTADRIRVGGMMILDDTQIWSVNIVKQFLMREPEWVIERDLWPRSAIFRRISEGAIAKNEFHQPFVVERTIELLFPDHINMIRPYVDPEIIERTVERLRGEARALNSVSSSPASREGPEGRPADPLIAERDELAAQRDQLEVQRDQLMNDRDQLVNDREEERRQRQELTQSVAEAQARLDAVHDEIDSLYAAKAGLESQLAGAKARQWLGLPMVLTAVRSLMRSFQHAYRRLLVRLPQTLIGWLWHNPLFDSSWYRERYPDVREKGVRPEFHYRRHGVREARKPNPFFDTRWYLERNRDVAASGLNPLDHYLLFGAAEGRNPSRLFDTAWYLAENPEVAASGLNPLLHFLRRGMAEGRQPTPPSASARPRP